MKCPKCNNSEFWATKDKRLKCKSCRYIFKPKVNLLKIEPNIINLLISSFILEHPVDKITKNIKISKYKTIKFLDFIRESLILDTEKELNLTNKTIIVPKEEKDKVIGIMLKNNKIYSKILDIEPKDFKKFIKNYTNITKKEPWMENLVILFKKRFYRLIPSNNTEINNFISYLKNKLAIKGGIRKKRLPLYIGEYVWRYNHKNLSLKEIENIISQIVFQRLQQDNQTTT
jgi:hypothetical protein